MLVERNGQISVTSGSPSPQCFLINVCMSPGSFNDFSPAVEKKNEV